ncbi:RNA polymerase sigma factor [Nitrospirillum viridazoti]|uniref:RNA polymerase subunit sigma-70 n=1 Tax=Nitrospirillum viridazoti CBAmc TaxID=1441467 RepID=A0A248JPE6_9PROT|nr:sigma-70 family RNA polymerase sigma factor [Nitrospirillum amazonense]ASG20104.1 RNA polymerase subunit sigma-70 [Nitrospirillum amazonense CBAmc]TWB36194.1 RNA polymerase sigma-70 factor (ECF subfamily) [Nitrospirillum amazonense]
MTEDSLPERTSLYRFIMRRVGDPWVSEDLVQETFIRLFTYRLKSTVGDSAALCFRIAQNLVRDHFRASRRASTEELGNDLPCEAPRAEEVIMHRQRVAAFQRALDAMPPLRREVFVRRRLKGESLRDIAQTLDISEAAAEKHVVRALEWLHQEMSRSERARPRATRQEELP